MFTVVVPFAAPANISTPVPDTSTLGEFFANESSRFTAVSYTHLKSPHIPLRPYIL